VSTKAVVHLKQTANGFEIPKIDLVTEGVVPGIDEATFKATAEAAKKGCPVSKVLAGAEITLAASLAS
jgi:osmotically inducible protein OsmC